MSYKIRDANGVSRVSLQIPKYPPRPEQQDFPDPIAEDKFHENLICIDGAMPFKYPKWQII